MLAAPVNNYNFLCFVYCFVSSSPFDIFKSLFLCSSTEPFKVNCTNLITFLLCGACFCQIHFSCLIVCFSTSITATVYIFYFVGVLGRRWSAICNVFYVIGWFNQLDVNCAIDSCFNLLVKRNIWLLLKWLRKLFD